jgi:predicted RNA-binding protein associated with RNAse of E/G family
LSNFIRLHYHRPPARTDIFEQELLYQSDDVLVTFAASTQLAKTLIIDGKVALEHGSPAIWFSFPGLEHDIGRFHDAAGVFTGLYANVVTPLVMNSATEWRMTDLFLDVWIGKEHGPRVLDEDEYDHAVSQGWITSEQAGNAQREVERIVSAWETGTWPPAIVNEWTIERVSSLRR